MLYSSRILNHTVSFRKLFLLPKSGPNYCLDAQRSAEKGKHMLFEVSGQQNVRMIDLGLQALPLSLRRDLEISYLLYDPMDILYRFDDCFIYSYEIKTNVCLEKLRKVKTVQKLNVSFDL